LAPSDLCVSAIASSVAVHQGAVWVVDATFTARGAVGWDTLAHRYFHEIIGVDLDGQALSVPLTEPTQSAFTSFAGRVQIGGNFDEHLAQTLAAVLNSGPLGTPLTD